MNTSNQTQTNFTAGQIIAIVESMSSEQKTLLRSIERLNNAELRLTNRYHKKVAQAATLVDLKIVDTWDEAFPIKKSVYAINDLGWAVWHYIVNGTLPEVETAQTVEAAPTNIPLLPATTLTRPAPVIAETPAPVTPKIGDTITFTTKRGAIKTGVIEAISIKSVEKRMEYLTNANGFMYAVRPEQILPAKMPIEAPLMDADTAPVIQTKDELYRAVKEAEEIYIQYMRLDTFDLPADHATYTRKVNAHITYLRAQAAYLGISNEAMIAYLYGVGKALPSNDSAPTDVSSASQVSTPTTPIAQPEMPLERVLEASADQPRKSLFSAEAALSDRDKARIDRHVKAAAEQFDKGPLPTPEKKDWRDEYPTLVAVQQHRIEEQSRKNA